MSGGDRMGPLGGGPKTGRGFGYCAGNDQPGYAASQPAQRLGLSFRWGGRGRGYFSGRCRQNRFNTGFWPGRGRDISVPPPAPVPRDQEVNSLKVQIQELQKSLQEILSHIEESET